MIIQLNSNQNRFVVTLIQCPIYVLMLRLLEQWIRSQKLLLFFLFLDGKMYCFKHCLNQVQQIVFIENLTIEESSGYPLV